MVYAVTFDPSHVAAGEEAAETVAGSGQEVPGPPEQEVELPV